MDIWIVMLAAAALLVRGGQLVGAMGMARAKNVASSGFRSIADLCIAVLLFWLVGAAILFQHHNPVLGIRPGYLMGWEGVSGGWFAMAVMVLLATGIVGPAVSERSRLIVPLAVGGLLAGLLVPLVMHWTTWGWLQQLGFIDNAGAASIHLVPALCAAVAAVCVGSREGKYNRDGSSNIIPGHSVPMILVSQLLTLAGWTPYVLAYVLLSAAISIDQVGQIAANIMIAAAAAGAVSLVVGQIRFGKSDILLSCCGVMGGLVAVTASAARIGTPAAFLIGLIAGIIVPWMTVTIDLRWKIDDPGGVIAIHGVGGILSLLCAAVFAVDPQLGYFKSMGIQLLGLFVITITTIALSVVLMILLRAVTGLRSRDADEYDGLDLAEHDINAHPDFQQTMIKSYHLREA